MWPYDYFNEYSALINEFNLDSEGKDNKTRKIFISKWYGDKINGKDAKYEALKTLITGIENYEVINKDEGEIENWLKSKFEATIADNVGKGNININIFAKMLEASLVICEVTPIGHKEENGKKEFFFCPNVMAELGLALAWKIPEQVIAICDKTKREEWGFRLEDLPFNIRSYFAKWVDFVNPDDKEYGLDKYIIERIGQIKAKKTLIIKNIKSKLDRNSLSLLENKRGLIFLLPYSSNEDCMRYLLNLGILKTEIFPSSPITFGYSFTNLGRVILSDINHGKLYPQALADLFLIRYWQGYRKNEVDKYNALDKDFQERYKIDWDAAYNIFLGLFQKKVDSISDDNFGFIDMFCSDQNNFDVVMEKVVKPWEDAINAVVKNRKNSVVSE